MLKKYEPLEDYLEEQILRAFLRQPLSHLASEIMEELGYHTVNDLQHALVRTFEVCCTLSINIPAHFRRIYVYSADGVYTDWQLSDLGTYLLLVNGNSKNPHVARAQLYYLK